MKAKLSHDINMVFLSAYHFRLLIHSATNGFMFAYIMTTNLFSFQDIVQMMLDGEQKQTYRMDTSAMINLSRYNLFVGKI